VLLSFERRERGHSREGGNPLHESLEKHGIKEVDSRLRGNDRASKGFHPANDTGRTRFPA